MIPVTEDHTARASQTISGAVLLDTGPNQAKADFENTDAMSMYRVFGVFQDMIAKDYLTPRLERTIPEATAHATALEAAIESELTYCGCGKPFGSDAAYNGHKRVCKEGADD